MSDMAIGRDTMGVQVAVDFAERLTWRFGWLVEKWDQDQVDWATDHFLKTAKLREKAMFQLRRMDLPSSYLRRVLEPDLGYAEGNLLLNEGIQLLEDLLIGAGGTVYSNANAQLGIGDSSAAEAATQTDLQAATNKTWKAMNATYPSRATQTLTFQSDFLTGDANYAWNEASIRNGAAADKNLNRKVVSLGTKASGTWTLTGTVTIS